MNLRTIEQNVQEYYTKKLKEHGPTPKGVDWKDEQSQVLRFNQLIKLVPDSSRPYSLLDFGCGYGALLAYLQMKKQTTISRYTGFDISNEMIRAAASLYHTSPVNIKWTTNRSSLSRHDFVITSGIFNVRGTIPVQAWKPYILKKLEEVNGLSKLGFSFNMLTSFADRDKRKKSLYYAKPDYFLSYCLNNFSRHVTLLHDYPLYEFTIIVRKELNS